jgi:hypothetical protein
VVYGFFFSPEIRSVGRKKIKNKIEDFNGSEGRKKNKNIIRNSNSSVGQKKINERQIS